MLESVKDQLFLLFFQLYILCRFSIFLKKKLKKLKIPISILSFVNDRLLIAQNRSLTVSNSLLFCSYHIVSSLLEQFRLIIVHGKMKVFHFSRSHGNFKLPALDLMQLGGPILWPKNTWQYLEFIFDRKLTFWQHVDFYTNKAMSTIKCMKMLRKSSRGLIPTQKQLLYRSCVLPVTLYGF